MDMRDDSNNTRRRGTAYGALRRVVEQLPRPATAHLGWSLLLSWVFCVFYLHSVGLALGSENSHAQSGMVLELSRAGAPLAFSVATLVAIVAGEAHLGSLAARRRWRATCPILAAAGTLLLYLPATAQLSEVFFWAGALLTGLGSAPLWVMWGELYARLEQGVAEVTASVAAVLAAVVALVCASLTGWMALAVAAALPLGSGVALSRAERKASREDDGAREVTGRPRVSARIGQVGPAVASPLRSFGREGQGILVASAVVCYAGSFAPGNASLGLTQTSLALAALLACGAATAGILTPRRFNLQFLYRWMCPFTLACLASVIWFPGPLGAELSNAGSIGARMAFCLLTQVCFARIAAEGRFTALQVFGLGWICLHLGDLLGVILNDSLSWLAPEFASSASCVLALSLAMVASVMFSLNGTDSFSRERTALIDLQAPLASTPTRVSGGPAADPLDARVIMLATQHELTARETEVLGLLARGRSNPYIRDELGISLDTAGTHVKHVYAKLGVHSRQELIDLVRQMDG